MFRTLRKSSSARRVLGFTLIEVLMVAAAILILVGIAVPNFVNALEKAKVASAKQQLISYKAALSQYFTDTRRYPESGSEHFYYALSGIAPFNQNSSRRYNPPYYEFDPALIGKPVDSLADYDTYNEDPLQTAVDGAGGGTNPVSQAQLRPVQPYASAVPPVPFHPILDPWGRPIIYISPDDLRDAWNQPGENPWHDFLAYSDETRFNDRNFPMPVPFDMTSGQFWSAGRDGITAQQTRGSGTDFGFFQPGNLLRSDGRDNDRDGSVDASDIKAKGHRNPALTNHLAEDDVASWN